MARVKPKIETIGSVNQADRVLAEIGELTRQVGAIEADLNAAIDQAKAEAKARSEPLRERLKSLADSLAAFGEYNKGSLFEMKRSLELVFGVIGFRRSTKLKTKSRFTWAKVLEKLKEYAFDKGIRVKEEVDREELRTWPDERLDVVGVVRVEEDEFYFELKEQRLEQAA